MLLTENKAARAGQTIGNGSTANNQTWIGSFGIKDFLGYGMRRIEIRDQYGRVFARSIVRSINVSIRPVDNAGQIRRFEILLDSAPASLQSVRALAPGANKWVDAQVDEGVVRLAGRWEEGGDAEFDINGSIFKAGAADGRPGFAQGALPLFALAMGALGAVLIFARRQEFRITIPSEKREIGAKLAACKEDIVKIVMQECKAKGKNLKIRCGIPSSAEEIARAMRMNAINAGAREVDIQSMEAALEKIAESGELLKCNNRYIPASECMESEDARMLCLLEFAYGESIIHGHHPKIRMRREGGRLSIMLIAGDETWMIAKRGQGAKEACAKSLAQRIFFLNEEEIHGFLASAEGREECAKLEIAIKTRRVRLVFPKQE